MNESVENEVVADYSILQTLATTLSTIISDETTAVIVPTVKSIKEYSQLAGQSQVLFLRLYLRKRTWLKQKQISYREVHNVGLAITELIDKGFLKKIVESKRPDLPCLLKLLSLSEVKLLCKTFNAKSGNKSQMCENIQKLCKSQKTLFGNRNGLKSRVEKKCLELVGDMVKVVDNAALVFDKVLILSFPQYLFTYEEDSQTSVSGRGHLSRILLSQFGLALSYPKYKVRFSKRLFLTSYQLDTFLSACQTEAECWEAIDKKDWVTVAKIHDDIIAKFGDMISTSEKLEFNDELAYMEQYTEVYVFARVLRQCVNVLKRLKRYTDAIDLLNLLLRFQPMKHRRGSWWESLSLIYHHHLKDEDTAIAVTKKGLNDSEIKDSARAALDYRLSRLDSSYVPIFDFEPKTVTIEIVAIEGSGTAANSRNIYVGHNEGKTYLCNVEDGALNYYKSNYNYAEGFHCEGSIVSTMFCILFWDIIFTDIDNVFYNEYQYCPLDFHTDAFFSKRKNLIEARLELLSAMTEQEFKEFADNAWNDHYNIGCSGLRWDLFKDLEQFKRCITCISLPKLALLLKEYCKEMRSRRGGLPDLSIWDYDTKRFIMVEVKGPGDTIRFNQKCWMKFLESAGIASELCNVRAISSKRLNSL